MVHHSNPFVAAEATFVAVQFTVPAKRNRTELPCAIASRRLADLKTQATKASQLRWIGTPLGGRLSLFRRWRASLAPVPLRFRQPVGGDGRLTRPSIGGSFQQTFTHSMARAQPVGRAA